MNDLSENWVLDPRLQQDTKPVKELEISSVRLMNDQRWPWLILVPRIANAEEFFDLRAGHRDGAMNEAAIVGQKLQTITSCEKINIAMIGNMVRQLHIHVVARNSGDANWPGPIWGYGKAQAYSDDHAVALVAHLKAIL